MSNNKQQTAVELLINEISRRMLLIHVETNKPIREVMILNLNMDLDRFKEMEKEQMIDFANEYSAQDQYKISAKDYYKENYGGNK